LSNGTVSSCNPVCFFTGEFWQKFDLKKCEFDQYKDGKNGPNSPNSPNFEKKNNSNLQISAISYSR
jgi:hypothetical protein